MFKMVKTYKDRIRAKEVKYKGKWITNEEYLKRIKQ